MFMRIKLYLDNRTTTSFMINSNDSITKSYIDSLL